MLANSELASRDLRYINKYSGRNWSEMIRNLSIKTKMFDFEERVLIGWVENTVREPTNQEAYLGCQ